MPNKQLEDYIKKEEVQGYTPDQLYQLLVKQGYNPNEVREAIDAAAGNPAAPDQPGNNVTAQTSAPKSNLGLIIGVLFLIIIIAGVAFWFFTMPVCGDGKMHESETWQNCCADVSCPGQMTCDSENMVCKDPVCAECQYLENHVCKDYECCKNEDCTETQICQDHNCAELECGECQYAENHECKDHECCDNDACLETEKCQDNKCIEVVGLTEEETVTEKDTGDFYCAESENEEIPISFCSEKSNYELQEDTFFDISTDYTGEPKEVAMITKRYREGFERVFYKDYTANLSNSEIKYISIVRDTSFKNDKQAFIITDKSSSAPKTSFIYEGNYIYLLYVYDCEELLSHNLDCTLNGLEDTTKDRFKSLFFWKDTDFENMMTNVSNIASLKLDISVSGGKLQCTEDQECQQPCESCNESTHRCTPEFRCVECTSKKHCKKGYECRWNKCIPDPEYCEDVSDCSECGGCSPGAVICRNNNCDYCSPFSGKENSCLQGYTCEDWGCVDVNVLDNVPKCKIGICAISNKTINPEIGCVASSEPSKHLRCMECHSNLNCKSDYYCHNYECVQLDTN
ncbi:hypothetical protein ACFL0W_01950 [Nanoarchaeota archaeon]